MSMIGFGTKVLSLLDEASYSTTYKFALLLALIDRTRQGVSSAGVAPTRLSTTSVAERILELYWPQSAPFPGTKAVGVLKQSGRGQAAIVSRLAKFRAHHGLSASSPARGLSVLTGYERLLRDVEWSVAEMPLPRLQRPFEPFIYEIHWDESVSRSNFFATPRFIELIGDAGEHLVRLEPLIRPVVERRWALMVGGLNRDMTDEALLQKFLFEPQRHPPKKLLRDLTDLQANSCFYCRQSLRGPHIDHFIPWAHSLDDGLDNLVLACQPCNSSKSAHRAAAAHVGEWSSRFAAGQQEDLRSIASAHGWEKDSSRTLGLARSTYFSLPEGTKLWQRKGSFREISDDRQTIFEVLAAAAPGA
jgi:hypothetical protein